MKGLGETRGIVVFTGIISGKIGCCIVFRLCGCFVTAVKFTGVEEW